MERYRNAPDQDAHLTPPYAAFAAFEALVQRAANEDVPARVDKPLLVAWGIAAGNESGLLTSLRSLGLIDADGRPTEDYRALRLSAPRRQAALLRSLERAYPGLATTGAEELDEDRLHDYFVEERGLTGQMVDKAMRFYRRLVAASDAGSALVERGTSRPAAARPGRPAGATPRTTGAVSPAPGAETDLEPPAARRAALEPRAIELGSFRPGLSVVVHVPVDATEEQLVALFRRVLRAWDEALGDARRP